MATGDPSKTTRRGFRFSLRTLFAVVAIVAIVLAMPIAWYRYQFPYGMIRGCDKQLGFALLEYAQTNGGKFPNGGATPEASLGLLYPMYADASLFAEKRRRNVRHRNFSIRGSRSRPKRAIGNMSMA